MLGLMNFQDIRVLKGNRKSEIWRLDIPTMLAAKRAQRALTTLGRTI